MADAPRIVAFDLMPQEPDYYFVLTEALQEFAARQRAEAAGKTDTTSRIRWAETAEQALGQIEAAMSEKAEGYKAVMIPESLIMQTEDERLAGKVRIGAPAVGRPGVIIGPFRLAGSSSEAARKAD